jgi:hypothetical protein
MTSYLVPVFVFYLGVIVCILYRRPSRLVVLTCSAMMFFLVILRGHTGTDTAAYYSAFMDLDSGQRYGGEPLFNGIAQMFWWINPDPRFVVNGISALVAIIILNEVGITRNGLLFGGLILVPAMFYELSMNVMRFGLASSVFLLATRVSPEKKPARFFIYALVGTMIHFSSAILFLLYLVTTQRRRAFVSIFVSLIVLIVSLAMPGYFDDKLSLYSGMVAPNATSGLIFFGLQLMLIFIMFSWERDFGISRFSVFVYFGAAIALYLLTQVTYAGIRFQLILLYLLILVMWRNYRPAAGYFKPARVACFFLIGAVALAGRIHNMADEMGQGDSPFLPYKTIPSLEGY